MLTADCLKYTLQFIILSECWQKCKMKYSDDENNKTSIQTKWALKMFNTDWKQWNTGLILCNLNKICAIKINLDTS